MMEVYLIPIEVYEDVVDMAMVVSISLCMSVICLGGIIGVGYLLT